MTSVIADRRDIILRLFKVLASVCLFVFAAQALAAQPQENTGTQYVIERIEIIGNRRIQFEALLARMRENPGDPYSVEAVRRDVQALRNTGFFDDVRLEVEDSPDRPNAKIVAFYVSEKPIIRRIEYRGIKSITESDILDAFKDKNVALSFRKPVRPNEADARRSRYQGIARGAGTPICNRKGRLRENWPH